MNHEHEVFCIKCSRDQTEELLDMKTYVFFPCLDLYNNFVEIVPIDSATDTDNSNKLGILKDNFNSIFSINNEIDNSLKVLSYNNLEPITYYNCNPSSNKYSIGELKKADLINTVINIKKESSADVIKIEYKNYQKNNFVNKQLFNLYCSTNNKDYYICWNKHSNKYSYQNNQKNQSDYIYAINPDEYILNNELDTHFHSIQRGDNLVNVFLNKLNLNKKDITSDIIFKLIINSDNNNINFSLESNNTKNIFNFDVINDNNELFNKDNLISTFK